MKMPQASVFPGATAGSSRLTQPPQAASTSISSNPVGPGSIDSSFGYRGSAVTPIEAADFPQTTTVQPDGKIIVAGCSGDDASGGATHFALARYTGDGLLDNSFGSHGVVTTLFGSYPDWITCVKAVLVQPDGKIVAVGYKNTNGFVLARYNSDGSPDITFGGGTGRTTLLPPNNPTYPYIGYGQAAALQPDGKIVVAGYGYDRRTSDTNHGAVGGVALARFNANGSLDVNTFGHAGVAGAPGGWIVKSFTSDAGDASANQVLIQPDGKIVVSGTISDRWSDAQGQLIPRLLIARFSADGYDTDGTFGTGGSVAVSPGGPFDYTYNGAGVVAQPDGKFVVAGSGAAYDASGTGHGNRLGLARFSANGSLDPSFGAQGKISVPAYDGLEGGGATTATGLVLQRDGRLVLGGTASNATCCSGRQHFGLARFNPDGSQDSGFGTSGSSIGPPFDNDPQADARWAQGYAYGLACQADGKLVLAGIASDGNRGNFGVARYLGNPQQASCYKPEPGTQPPPPPPPPPPNQPRVNFVAVGDSVTAGFGYNAAGNGLSPLDVGHCAGLSKPQTAWPACQGPLSVAYPAVYARRKRLGTDQFSNAAVEGSTAYDWAQGKWRSRLDRVVASAPTLTVLTLGADPALTDVIIPGNAGYDCFHRARSGPEAANCADYELNKNNTVHDLETVYQRLLSANGNRNRVAVFLYYNTIPVTLSFSVWPPSTFDLNAYQNGIKVFFLNQELNKQITRAITTVAAQLSPEQRTRIRAVEPGPFEAHTCTDQQPWILKTDTCIHPTADGHIQLASQLAATYPSA